MRKNAKEEVLMKCITQEVGIELLEEIHSGTCGNHAASRTLVGKAFRAHEIQTIPASWPFACWGLDMIGPFKPAPGNFKCVFVMIDKFSKWIEYIPLTKASSEKSGQISRPDHTPFRPPQQHHHRPADSVHWQRILGLLRLKEHCCKICVGGAS
jgi:hypothetical protein